LGYYARILKVVYSIPDEAILIFNSSNPSSRIVVLGLTQSLAEIITKDLPGGKERPVLEVDLIAICEPII
jgi:hypothetical protein